MTAGTIVLDLGKTNTKVSLWDEQGRVINRWIRANDPRAATGYLALDVPGIEHWLMETLAACAREASIRRIVPVGHGAAAALVRDNDLFVDPMDYEEPIGEVERQEYARQRDPFWASGSPLLPGALNLGMQLHRIESLYGPLPVDVTILPWPQYWAWRLCGVMASEVTSLGCHTDLWRPMDGRFTDLAVRRGWAERLAPLRRAAETLSTITADIAARTGLPPDCDVLCGLHDSNAALLASRGHRELADRDATVLSTGTWFVAMRSLAPGIEFDGGRLPESRDCLINVDVHGRGVPSARFMGGREAELLRGEAPPPVACGPVNAMMRRLPDLLADDVRAYPSFVAGVGPFPAAVGRSKNLDGNSLDRRIITALYLAMMTDTSLNLIESTDLLLVEGRFAEETLFVRALAALRPHQPVFTCDAHNDLAYGALRLVAPDLAPPSGLTRVEPLEIDLQAFADDWRSNASTVVGADLEVRPESTMR